LHSSTGSENACNFRQKKGHRRRRFYRPQERKGFNVIRERKQERPTNTVQTFDEERRRLPQGQRQRSACNDRFKRG